VTADLDAALTLRSGLVLHDRVALAPLTNTQSQADGSLSDQEYRWLVRRARDGFRFVSTCAAYVSDEGKAWRGQLGAATRAHVEGLTRLADGLHEAGAHAVVQLHHAGAKATEAPVRLSTADAPDHNVRGAGRVDLARVVDAYVEAARRAQRAGFDGVEIHGANGYIFTQFLAPRDNPRTDEYGGSLENRARLIRETLRAVRSSVGSGFTVGVRISPVDVWNVRGLLLADGVALSRWLAEDGADFIHLSLSDASGPPPHEVGTGPVARAIRDALPEEVPVFAAGGIWTLDDAQRARAAGVDVVVVGKAGIAHPNWSRAVQQAGFEPMRPPWSTEALAARDVGPDFVKYLSGMRRLIEGAKPTR